MQPLADTISTIREDSHKRPERQEQNRERERVHHNPKTEYEQTIEESWYTNISIVRQSSRLHLLLLAQILY